MNFLPTHTGTFYLVGTGPGNPELLTVKAMELLSRADVVIRLSTVSPNLLSHCNPHALHRTLGSPLNEHETDNLPEEQEIDMEEQKTNLNQPDAFAWIVENLQAGKTVCLLVPGNPKPTVGPWASWQMDMQAQGLAFEVIPGVPARHFFEEARKNLPLFGKTILITRSVLQASGLQAQLEALGARVLLLPTIQTLPPEYPGVVAQQLRNIAQYDWVVFTSKNGVDQTMQLLFSMDLDVRQFGGVKIAAVGAATAEALKTYGLVADLVPPQYLAKGLYFALRNRGELVASKRFLLLQGNIANDTLKVSLRQEGAEVTQLVVYRTVDAPDSPKTAALVNAFLAGQVDMITFGSPSAATNFAKRMAPYLQQTPHLLDNVLMVAIGPLTAQAVRECFGQVHLQTAKHTTAGLVEAIRAYYTGSTEELTRTP